MKYLVVTGMFRSGTTLLAKMLDANPGIVCLPEILTPCFNAFRDHVAARIGRKQELMAPIDDYFANGGNDLLDAILEANFSEPFDHPEPGLVVDRIRSRARMTAPKVAAVVDDFCGTSFLDAYQRLVNIIPQVYGRGTEQWIGHKEVWVPEFIPALARSLPEAKFIIITRDPRGVVASKNLASLQASCQVKREKYPWLFLLRHWRKIAILTWWLIQHSQFRQRIHHVRYEDLVVDPQGCSRRLCDFLSLPYAGSMVDASCFRDGQDGRWRQNSSYLAVGKQDGYLIFRDGTGKIDAGTASKWQEVMSPAETAWIEQLCWTEMNLFGYQRISGNQHGLTPELLAETPWVDPAEMQDWIAKTYEGWSRADDLREMGKEMVRQALLRYKPEQAIKIEETTLRSFFTRQEYYQEARKILEEGRV